MSDQLESIDSFEAKGGGTKSLPNSTAVLVLGIISIVGCFCYGVVGLITAIIAIVLHKKDKELYETNPSAYEASFKNSKAGNICAIIGLSLSAIYLIIIIVALVANGGNFNSYSRW